MSRVTAIVPLHEGEHSIAACLDALLAGDAPEVVIVDDASTDGGAAIAAARAEESGGRVRLVRLEQRRGFAGAVNRGVEAALASAAPPDVVVLVNQDCIVSHGWLEPLVRALADERVGIVGARLLEHDGITLQHAGASVGASGLTSHVGRGSRDAGAFREDRDVEYVCGALMAMRADTWRRFGPLDEGYFPAYFEDVELCANVRRAGLAVRYVASSEARHLEASTSGRGSREYLRRYHRSRLRFVARHIVREAGLLRWVLAETSWLVRQRRWSDVAPVIPAYASLLRSGDRA